MLGNRGVRILIRIFRELDEDGVRLEVTKYVTSCFDMIKQVPLGNHPIFSVGWFESYLVRDVISDYRNVEHCVPQCCVQVHILSANVDRL